MSAKVFHAELFGIREHKYGWLLKHDINTTKWKALAPKSESSLFIPRDERSFAAYETYLKITDIFPVNSVGIVTARDEFVIDFDKDKLRRRILQFRDKKLPDEIMGQTYGLKDKSNWKLTDAREEIVRDDEWERHITKILYRPFDERWIFYHDAVIERSRKEVMQHMMHENLGLVLPKRVETKMPWCHVSCTGDIAEHVSVSLKTIDYLFPLYLYEGKPISKKRSSAAMLMIFEPQAEFLSKRPNISPEVLGLLTGAFRKEPSPEQIFHYIYAVLYSNTYRTKYAEFLKMDFPRVPFTNNYKLFKKMAEYGDRLASLHLLKSPALERPIARFQGKGDNRIEKPKLSLRGRAEAISKDEILRSALNDKLSVYINKEQYFEGIPIEVWSYQIGGYQVCEKWLKDRKGRELTLDDIQTYCRIATTISKTIEIQKSIDALYEEVEENAL